MIAFLLFIFLPQYQKVLSDLCEDDKYEYLEIKDNNLDIVRLFYGDLTNMTDMYLPRLDEINDSESNEDNLTTNNLDAKDVNLKLDYLKETNLRYDIKEFNDITKLLNNATRRYNSNYHGWTDPQDPRYFSWLIWFYVALEELEQLKKDKLMDLNVQYLIHTRYQVKKAIEEKHEIRLDKRYRLGYLFNRLRRIKYEQQKIVSYSHEQIKSWYRDLTSQIKLYEKMVRYDVDITDTIQLIKDIDKEKSPLIPITMPKD